MILNRSDDRLWPKAVGRVLECWKADTDPKQPFAIYGNPYLKPVLKSMFVSLLTGISFAVGVMLVLLLRDIYAEYEDVDETWVDYPEGVVIANHKIKANSPRLTIVGEIQNGSTQNLKSIWVDVDVFAGDALVNTCDDSFRHIPANSTKHFEVQCYDVAGTNLPDYIRYEVRVRTVLRQD